MFKSFMLVAGLSIGSSLWCSETFAETTLPKEFKGLSEEQQEEAAEFIFGNAIHVVFHEAGHMLVSELELPVLGKEEDAVDALSTIMLLEAKDEALDIALANAADGWFLSDLAAQEAGEEYAFWGEHSLDLQRAYSIVCMMVGHDEKRFAEYADDVELPDERRENCASEYQTTLDSWDKVLAPHLITNESVSKFEIIYEEPKTADLAPYADLIKEIDVLGAVQEAIGSTYQLKSGIKLRAASCEEENAFWDPEARELTFCYELAQFHAGLLVDYFAKQAQEAKEKQ